MPLTVVTPSSRSRTTLGTRWSGWSSRLARASPGLRSGGASLSSPTCRAGRARCAQRGGMADLFTVPADRLHVLPDDLDDTTAALVEPLSTPVHAVRLGGDSFGCGLDGVRGRSAVVLGAGTIGLLVLAVLEARGAG